jgi:hypothetical protein
MGTDPSQMPQGGDMPGRVPVPPQDTQPASGDKPEDSGSPEDVPDNEPDKVPDLEEQPPADQ